MFIYIEIIRRVFSGPHDLRHQYPPRSHSLQSAGHQRRSCLASADSSVTAACRKSILVPYVFLSANNLRRSMLDTVHGRYILTMALRVKM